MKKIRLILFLSENLQSPLCTQNQIVQSDLSKLYISQVENQNLPGNDYRSCELSPDETCQTCIDSCLKGSKCKAYTFDKKVSSPPLVEN